MVRDVIDKVRQNHAIEHGTVSVLLERGASPPLGGVATPLGFFIFGSLATDDVDSATDESIERLKAGRSEMAISPYCGTNLVVGAFMGAALAAVILSRSKNKLRSVPAVANAILVTSILRTPLGNALQRRVTTLADVADLEITAVRRLWSGAHWISTGPVTDSQQGSESLEPGL